MNWSGWRQRWERMSLAARSWVIAGGLAIPAAMSSGAQGEELRVDLFQVTPQVAAELGAAPVWEISAEDAEEAARSEYWVGVQLGELPDLVKSQLSLEYGLATLAVMPDSPALAAGLQAHDILLKVGDKPLREPIELVRAVNEAKEQKIKLTYLRQGKEREVEIQPGKRPMPQVDPTGVARVFAFPEGDDQGPEIAALERALRALDQNAKGDKPLGMWFVRPPILAPQDGQFVGAAFELPEDVSVQVNKTGSQPATAVVKRGSESWNVTADKLDALPEELRAPVGRMMGNHQVMTLRAQVLKDGHLAVPGMLPPGAVPGNVVVKPMLPGTTIERRAIVVGPDGKIAPGAGEGHAPAELNRKLDIILERLDATAKGAAGNSGNSGNSKPSGGVQDDSKYRARLQELEAELKRLTDRVQALQDSSKK